VTLRLAHIHLYPEREGQSARLGAYLAALGPGVLVSPDEIADLLWGRRPDGGPEALRQHINVVVTRLRAGLQPGWHVVSRHGRGIELVFIQQQAAVA